MDILIKDLPLPQKGEYDYHLTIRSDGKVEGTQQVGERIHSIHTWAIEIPPHGRLGDLDKLAEEFDEHGLYLEEEVKKIIDFFPVVLEASTEEINGN